MSNKNYCPTHHLYYEGDVCPICQSEKYAAMDKKYNQPKVAETLEDEEEVGEVTEESLMALMDKFNNKN